VLSNPTSIAQWESYGEEGQRQLLDRIPTRRLGEAEDIAHGVSFFVSPASSWISGQTLSIDGGHALF
jgi:3-oxoacyl-[acyl-carrier protein] reductase